MQQRLATLIRPYDKDALREQFRSAEPFPHLVIDDFLAPTFAREVARAYPSFAAAAAKGRMFDTVNEKLKLQLTDVQAFAEPVRILHEALASAELLSDLEHITGIAPLLADPRLDGGGIHMTGAGGRLDVHVDFNIHEVTGWHRRLNILVYFNEGWQDAWGGQLELWDKGVQRCARSLAPAVNRCVLFATDAKSYHGVQPVKAPLGIVRKSFAAYYYTAEAPAGWDGTAHSTSFRARPEERAKRWLWMPAERLWKSLRRRIRSRS